MKTKLNKIKITNNKEYEKNKKTVKNYKICYQNVKYQRVSNKNCIKIYK